MVYGDYDPIETTIVDDLRELCEKVYDKMASISGITGLEFKGFGSSKQTLPLPQIGMKMSLIDFQVDRTRPPAGVGNRVLIESGTPVDYEVDGETQTVYPERIAKKPLPVVLTFGIDTWCHNQVTQLQMDQKILQKFPERGVLTLTFGEDPDEEDFEFNVRLIGTRNLDDLAENYRERIYQYELETYIPSHFDDETLKVITSEIFELYGDMPDDPTDIDSIADFVAEFDAVDTVSFEPEES